MKKISIIALFISIITYAQNGNDSNLLTNMITLATAENLDYACGDLILYSDVDASIVNKYSSISVNVDRYVKEFGEYSLKPDSQYSVFEKKDGIITINEIDYDPSRGGYFIKKRSAYLIFNGNVGVTYNEDGVRHSEMINGVGGTAKLDAKGRIISYDWLNQPLSITYNKDGKINSLAKTHKYSIMYKNGIISEITQTQYYTNNYASQKNSKHWFYEVVEMDENGHWRVIDEYTLVSGVKTKTKRYTRKFN